MPVLPTSSFRPVLGLRNGHLQTIFPAVFRRTDCVTNQRVRIKTPDGDFLDLDCTSEPDKHERTAIISHGLEGHSRQHYVQGMAAALLRRNWNVIAWNFRGCSGEPNRLLRSYHSGATEDLQSVIEYTLHVRRCRRVGLVGFSLGGNLSLKLLGDAGVAADPRICGAVTFSVPCDLAGAAARLSAAANRVYLRRFLRCLRWKIRLKHQRFPDRVDITGLDQIRSFREFDDRYTGPMHGFAGAEDYWDRCSCQRVLARITVPTLIVNARNDPFLSPSCFPVTEAEANPRLSLEMPASGGHVGFAGPRLSGEYWSESRAAGFLHHLSNGA